MKSTVKIAFEFNKKEIENLMLQKGYDKYTEKDLVYELSKLDIEELRKFAYCDIDDKEIIIY